MFFTQGFSKLIALPTLRLMKYSAIKSDNAIPIGHVENNEVDGVGGGSSDKIAVPLTPKLKTFEFINRLIN